MCHNPVETDAARRPRLNAVRKRLNFALMIHRIHGGKSQARYYTIYGYGNTPHNYNEIASRPAEFVHDVHEGTSYMPPVKAFCRHHGSARLPESGQATTGRLYGLPCEPGRGQPCPGEYVTAW